MVSLEIRCMFHCISLLIMPDFRSMWVVIMALFHPSIGPGSGQATAAIALADVTLSCKTNKFQEKVRILGRKGQNPGFRHRVFRDPFFWIWESASEPVWVEENPNWSVEYSLEIWKVRSIGYIHRI